MDSQSTEPAPASTRRGVHRPGDNPNKAKAQGRSNYRPRSKNVLDATPSEFATNIRFADPVIAPSTPERPGGITVTEHVEYAGTVNIRLNSILEMAVVYAEATLAIGDVTDMYSATVASAVLIAQAAFSSARQIYSALTDSSKSDLTQYKGVYYFDSLIPGPLGPCVSIFGDFYSKIGKIGLRHATTRFLQFAMFGVMLIEDYLTSKPDSYKSWNSDLILLAAKAMGHVIFDTPGWQRFALQLGQVENDRLLNKEVTIPGTMFTVRARLIGTEETRGEYLTYLQSIGHSPEDSEVLASLQILVRDEDTLPYSWLTDPDQKDMQKRIDYGVPQGDDVKGSKFMDRFNKVQGFIENRRLFLNKLWELKSSPTTEHGFAAQLVSLRSPERGFMTGTDGSTPVGMSDMDIELGHMLMPATDVQLNPDLQVYTVTPRLKTAHGYVEMSRRQYKM